MLNITETINSEHILTGISLKNRHYLTKIDVFDTINSTNTYLLEKINQKTASGWVCIANQQSAGRGRLGKTWYSPPGNNIYCSLFWRFEKLPPTMSSLGIAIAIMLAKMLQEFKTIPAIQIKWPNDLWVNGKKLGGILLETKSSLGVVIGIGLNLSLPTNKNLPQATSLHEITQQPENRNDLIALLLNTLCDQLPLFENEGLRLFIKDWDKFDALTGKEIKVYTHKMEIHGIMRGINEHGALILEDDAGLLRYFSYGEVSIRC